MKYFISRDSEVSGPFSKQQIRAAIKSKKLSKTDLLGTSANGPWQTVTDDFGELPAQKKRNAIKRRKALKKRKAHEAREEREAKESAEQSRNFKKKIAKRIAVGVLVVLFGPACFYTALTVSKPYKLRWAADRALKRMMYYTEALQHVNNRDDGREKQRRDRIMENMQSAAEELASIKSQMTPEARKAWEESKIEQAIEDYNLR